MALDEDRMWQAVLRRNAVHDGRFVYGVVSTGIYCRPSCPSRRPSRSRVRFFSESAAAEAAGFRACLRCEPRSAVRATSRGIVRAREYLDSHLDETVTLRRLSEVARMSPYHLQRTFKRVVGVSPKAYSNARRLEQMKKHLRKGHTVSRATYDAGYSSGSRAYEHARAGLGMTPATYRNGGRGMRISYTVADTPVGRLLAAATDRGLCAVLLGDRTTELENELRREYPEATIVLGNGELEIYTQQVVQRILGQGDSSIPLDVPGSAFQWQVWEALRRIPLGETRSYQAIAREIGRPGAARAVARACASNRVAVVIPCHRAVREDGQPGGYRWGVERKQELIRQEELVSRRGAAAR
jgi:AraC family transcriptional regulator of adaptative response/methylated-DNA-[protein]-cysteine methyltransferase